ncbi:MAG: glycosyltransferase [Bryobacteraceae bacterium]
MRIFEPEGNWSRSNLVSEHGTGPIDAFRRAYPQLSSTFYDPETANATELMKGADVAIVHEWNSHKLVASVGEARRKNPSLRLFFHDTHHRAVTAPAEMAHYKLSAYDGVLAYGESLRREYLKNHWHRNVHVWHEAADSRVFYPQPHAEAKYDVVWIGNWGDGERTAELQEFLIKPIKDLGLRAAVFGVRYPEEALKQLQRAGITYGGWVPNFAVPEIFAAARLTVHIPRRPYVERLPGIPTIRPFEALACGVPMISAPWTDSEHLFTPGCDYLVAHNGQEMKRLMKLVLSDTDLSQRLVNHGLKTVRERHLCSHRVAELLNVCQQVEGVANPRKIMIA